MKGRIARRLSLGLVPWIAIVAIWYGVRLSGYVNESLIPAPHQVAAKFVDLLLHEGLLYDIFLSTCRVFFGVALGIVAAVPIGFLLGWYRPFESVCALGTLATFAVTWWILRRRGGATRTPRG